MMKSLLQKANRLYLAGRDSAQSGLKDLLHKEMKIAITGLSRSGKSMLFTSLLTLLKDRAEQKTIDFLPLLSHLPLHRIRQVEVRPVEGEKMYPLQQSLAQLAKGQWPGATQDVYGFELYIELDRDQDDWLKTVSDTETLSFQFYDYTG